jgi:Skp family chaperone for outer membrane proteins
MDRASGGLAMNRMNKRLAVAAFAAAVVALAVWSQSQGQATPAPASSTLAVVDVVKIFDNYQKVRDFDAEIRKMNADYQNQDDAMAKQLEAMEKEVKDLAPGSLRADELMEKAGQIGMQRQMAQKTNEGRIARKRYQLSEDAYGELLKVIEALGRERGYDAILANDPFSPGGKRDPYRQIELKKVLYVRASLDVTDEVLKRLNAAYKPK